MRLSIILFLVFISVADCFCQNRNSVWCFGDSAGIDFNSLQPITFESGLDVRGSCTSIADNSGNLLFYASTSYKPYYLSGIIPLGAVYSKNHSLMLDGDSLIGRGWFNEMIITPFPDSVNLFYVFHVGVTTIYGFYYSIVDMTLNGGLGAVTQKNVMLDGAPADDCVITIKHGNGRDWWVLFKRSSFPFANPPNNEWHEYLVTPAGIGNYNMQQIGVPFLGNAAKLCVNPKGDKIVFTHYDGLVEAYDFDRCSGIISNARTIEYPNWPTVLYPCNDCAFSPSGNNLYVTLSDTFSALIQYNLLDTNPALTKDTLWYYNFPVNGIGAVRRAPDNKLYVSSAYYTGFWNYPYPDSMYNVHNMNLSVINQPDSLGAACDFQPYSFYLGGKRTYWGLPNNPDYDLGRDSGSVCDTIQWTSVQNIEQVKGLMYVTYVSDWQKLFVNAQGLKGRSFKISVYDMVGNVIYTEEGKLSGQYFTRDLNMAAFAKGMYIVNFATDKERLAKKFIKD